MSIHLNTIVVSGKTQADGAFDLELEANDFMFQHQIQVKVSATPDAGTLTITVKSPGASEFKPIADNSIDLTGTLALVKFTAFAAAVRITPASFDGGKTYDVVWNSG